MIGALLGHNQPATTACYGHLKDDPVKQASTLVAQRLATLMNKEPGDATGKAAVVPLKKRR